MNKVNQVLFSIAFFCLVLWYGYYVTNIRIVAADKLLEVIEDQTISIELISKRLKDKNIQVEILELPQKGYLSIEGKGYLYQPEDNYSGEDFFRYQLSSEGQASDPATVRITIHQENDAPIADNAEIKGVEDGLVKFSLTAEDFENDKLEYIISSYTNNGIIDGLPPNLTYKPYQDYHGADQLRFIVYDGKLRSEPAIVSFYIAPTNDPPIATNKSITTFSKTPIAFQFDAADIDHDPLTYEIIENPMHGHVRKETDRYIYIPTSRYSGSDLVTFVANDGIEDSEPAQIKIEVKSINRNVQLGSVLERVVEKGGVAIGEFEEPEHIFHPGKYTPASVLKIITAAASLHVLGEEYCFKTEISISEKSELIVKGYGDPTLSSKDWHDIAMVLQEKGIFQTDFTKLVIDTAAFSEKLVVDGRRATLNYFDAPPSTLASNENTAVVTIKRDRRIIVNDDYTPLTPMLIKKSRGLPSGVQRFNVALNSRESIEYSKELAQSVFEQYGALFEEEGEIRRIEGASEPIYVHQSKATLRQVIKQMLQQSNNFIANQLLLNIAYSKFGEGASIGDGVKIVSEFLKSEIDLNQSDFQIVEGSGLSTQNSINLLAMLKVLNYFTDFKQLLPSLSSSKYSELARSGRKWKILAKSGTLKNVSTLAGFILVENKEWKPFVIMLNNDRIQRGKVMEIIGQYYNG